MQQPRYFSTQPSANAVPAQQLMAMMPPQQQGHMVASGQPMQQAVPMMMPQQGMMVPPGYQPMMVNGQVMMVPVGAQMQMPQQQMVQQQKAVEATLPNNVTPKLTHAPGKKQFVVSGVADPNMLEIDAQHLSWQMTKQGPNFVYSYSPEGKIHNVSVTHNGENIEGSPFQLCPKELAHKNVQLELDADKKHLIASGVHDVDKLNFKTDMAYKLISDDKDPQKFHFKYETNGAVHPLDVTYDGKPVTDGQFEFVPKHMKAQRELQAQADQLKEQYEATLGKLNTLKLNDAPEHGEKKAIEAPKEVRSQQIKVAEDVTEKAVEVAANKPHMTETAPEANYGAMVMSSEQQRMVPQQQQQPMMAAQPMQPMMMPMGYAGGMAQPMYQMMPVQMQGQQPMYRQG